MVQADYWMNVVPLELPYHMQRFLDGAAYPTEACQVVYNSFHAAEEVHNVIRQHIQDPRRHLAESLGVADPMIGEEADVLEDLAFASEKK